MKKYNQFIYVLIVFVMVFGFFKTTSASGISFVQSSNLADDLSSTTISKSFTSSNTAGNAIVVGFSFDSTNGTLASCSDSLGNLYYNALTSNDPRHTTTAGICYTTNIKTGSNTVTVTIDKPSKNRRIAINEYSGISTTTPLDKTSTISGNSNPIKTLSVTPSVNGELVFGFVECDGYCTNKTGATAGTGFTIRDNPSDFVTLDMVQETLAPVFATLNFNQENSYKDYIIVEAVFTPAPVRETPTSTPAVPIVKPTDPCASAPELTKECADSLIPMPPVVVNPTPVKQIRVSNKILNFGMRSAEVLELQTFLIQRGYLKQTLPTSYFGTLTRDALRKYQCDIGVVCSGSESTTGFGRLGPKTINSINKNN